MRTNSSSERAVPALPTYPETPDVSGAYPRLSDDQLMLLSRYGERRQMPERTLLFHEGDRECDFFVVLSGTVAVVEETDDEPRLVAVHGPRRFLGDLSILTGQTIYLTAYTQEDREVLVVPLDRLNDAVLEDSQLGDLILRAYTIRRTLHLGIGAGLRIIGSRFSADSRRLRDFAARNRVPHRWIELEDDPEADAILQRLHIPPEQTPVVIAKGGHVLRNPTNEELAGVLGLRGRADGGVLDMVVVGAGPAGLAAAVYGASEGLDTVVLDAVATGGQAATSSQIENYLGFPAGISGAELADRAVVQARRFGATFMIPGEAQGLDVDNGVHVVRLADGQELAAHVVTLATGARYRRLDVPGMDRLEGSSVYYAATLVEAQLCRGDPVTVVGGGNSAGQATVFLSRHASSVNLVILHDDLGRDMSRYLVDRVTRLPNVRIWRHSEVSELVGDTELESVVLHDLRTDEHARVPSTNLFVLIGSEPHTAWLAGQIPLDDKGFILTGARQNAALLETGRPGVFAVGDVRSGSVKRVASAVGEGSIAVRLAHEYLRAGAGGSGH